MAEIVYDNPLLIKTGDKTLKFENKNFKNDNGHAVEVWTSEPVEFINCTFTATGNEATAGLKTNGYTSITLKGCKFFNNYDTAGNQKGRAVNNYRPRNFIMEHCEWQENCGVMLGQTDEWAPGKIKITNCLAKNATKAKKDGSQGPSHCQFIQLSGINTLNGYSSVEVGWIEGSNEYGKSWIEDGISITNCKGTLDKPINVHDIMVKGIYAPVGATSFSGSGLTIENGSTYVLVNNVQLVSCMNACANIAGGSNNTITKSRFVSASLLPDGTKTQLFWAGCCAFDSDNTPEAAFATNSIKDNTIGYNRWNDEGNKFPVAGRHDEMNIRKSKTGKITDNWMEPGSNTYLLGTIAKETEDNEYKLWQQKLKDNNQYVGVLNVTEENSDVTLIEEQILDSNIVKVLNKAGKDVDFKLIKYKIDDNTIASIEPSYEFIELFNLKAHKAGSTSGTIIVTSLSGKNLTKTFTIVVTAKDIEPGEDNEAYEIQIVWNK